MNNVRKNSTMKKIYLKKNSVETYHTALLNIVFNDGETGRGQ
jgi:hypothetical protein